MIFKTLLSLASAAFLAATATASSHDALPVQTFDSSEQLSRDLQLTGDTDFLITPTTVSTTDSTLTLSYTNGAGDGESPPGGRFDIFTLTSSGPITGTGLTNVDADPTLSCFSKGGSNFVYAPSTSGITGVSTIAASASTFAISFNENATATQPYYSATGPSTALIVKYFLCVKFTLTKDIGSGPAVETDINYRETALEVTLTLNGTIANATAFTVDTLDPGTDTDEVIEYTVSAGLCPSFTTTVTQGLTVPICIVSDQFPLASIDSIDELTFTATVPDPDVVQAIITGGSAADGATGLYGIATADAECPDNECIHVDVIVYAIFANEATTNLIVEISGDAVMSVGRTARKLRAKVQPTRELQETLQIQAFRNEIVLPPLPGSGATLANVCAAAVPFAVAVVAGALTL